MSVKAILLSLALVIFGCASAPLPVEFKNHKSNEYFEKVVAPIYCSDAETLRAVRGTAFFFRPNSLLTTKHIFENKKPENCYIYFFGVKKVDIKRVFFSPNSDITIIEVDYRSDSYLEPTLYWENVPPNKWLDNFLYIFPALVLSLDESFLTWRKGESRLIFSKNRKRIGREVFITNEENAMVRPGFSGSPVLGRDGKLVGMVVARCQPCASKSFFREDWPGFMLMISWNDLQYYFPNIEKFR